ncbi:filamentous hemagglutinin N-terminal domain-containing protein [Sphingomonas crocodyli]|uniref:filamentous hemagglutinin N-terminal domain-containing protein n=1 Tax=Sphingomonas crocodyli TaxID=1979270 RepID=UPI0013E2F9F7|nr:filamentous hemagglutinin N-terminal domain-containing protein [Sphingomonas crocodyli]
MKIRPAKIRHKLSVSTILMTGMIVVMPQTARAQALPTAGDVANVAISAEVGGAMPTISNPTATSLQVDLGANRTIIDWNGFNIPTGNSANFTDVRTAGAGTTPVAVLNRDISGVGSVIDGSLTTTTPNISVYLLNTAGITIGTGANVNVGALIASSLNITNDNDFLNGLNTLRFMGGANDTTGVTINGGTIQTASNMVFLGATVTQDIGASSTATGGSAAFVAGTDITMTASVGSPLAFQINRGTTVANAITASGTINGQNVTLAFATQDAVAAATLSVDANITATTATATDRGVVLAAGTAATGVTFGGTETNGDGAVVGGGDITSSGTVDITGRNGVLLVGTLTLNGVSTVSSATGNVTLTAVEGMTNGAGALTVTASSGVASLIGAINDIASLTIAGATAVTLDNGTVVTTGAQSYTGAVTLGANASLTGSTVSFASTVNGTQSLSITGDASFGGVVGGTNELTSLNVSGLSSIGADISTSGAQTYTGAVTLTGGATLASSSGGVIGFTDTVDGPFGLTVTSAGAKNFGAAVGGNALLTSLTTSGAGTTTIRSVSTSNAQSYGDATTLGADAILTGNGITFSSTLDGAQALTIADSGTTTFGGVVGTVALTSLTTNAGGTTAINGGSITTTGAQTYNDAITLATNNATLTSNNAGAISFDSTINGARALTVNTGGVTAFNGAVGGTAALTSLTTDAGGGTSIGANIRTANAQSYGDAITLTGDATLSSTGNSAFNFTTTIDGAFGLTVTSSGDTTFGAAVGGTTALTGISTNGGGTTNINTGSIRTSGAQSYLDNVVLGADVTLTNGGTAGFFGTLDSSGGNNFSLTAGRVRFDGAVGGTEALGNISVGVAAINGGAVTTTSTQSYGGAVTLGADTTLTSTSDAGISFTDTVNSLAANRSLTLATAGTTTFGGAVGGSLALSTLSVGGTSSIGASIASTGAQTYTGAVTLTGTSTISGAGLTFSSTINGAQALTLTDSGATSVTGAIGGNAELASLTVNGGGTLALTAGSVTTSGAQSYANRLLLAADTTLTSNSGGAITLTGGAQNAFALTTGTDGATSLSGGVGTTAALTSITTNGAGTLTLGGQFNATVGQSYNQSATTLSGLVQITGFSNSDVTFAGTVDGAASVVINTGGATTFTGAVGSNSALTSLQTDAAGTLVLTAGSVTTSSGQTYGENITLAADTTLTSTGGGVLFSGTVDGAQTLTISSATTSSFGAAVGNGTALASFTKNGAGTMQVVGGLVRTTGAQTYNSGTSFTTNATLTSTTGGDILLNSGSVGTNGSQTLTINTQGNSRISGASNLASITTDAGGTNTLSGTISTVGAQTYNGAITLAANTMLTSTGNADFIFDSTINGGFALTVNTTGVTTFGAAVGGTTALTTLTTNAGGTTNINGGSIATSGTQTFNDAVVLGANTTLTNGGLATFASTLNGAFSLGANAVSFGGAVGGTSPLNNLTVTTATVNGGSVATVGAQTYSGAVTLGAATTLSSSMSGNIALNGGTSGAFGLTINTAGVTTIAGATGVASITTDTGGTNTLGGTISTTGAQSYGGAINLAADTTLVSTGNSPFNFGSTIDGGFALTITSFGATTFGAAVGGTTALASLTTTDFIATNINGGSVRTTGNQRYYDLNLGGTTTLTSTASGDIAITNIVAGTGTVGLTVNTAGISTINRAYDLTSLTTDAGGTTALGGDIQTSGAQTYNDNVTLIADTTTNSGNAAITFAGTVNGNQRLTVITNGTTTFGGAVGGSTALSSLLFFPGGTLNLNGGGVTTTGVQNYAVNAVLGANTALTSTNSGAISFAGSVDGAFALTVNTADTTTFGGDVGGSTALQSLTTDAPGSLVLQSGLVTTTGLQSYGDSLNLSTDTILTSTNGGAITLGGTVNGAYGLTVNTTGATTFSGIVGGGNALTNLTTDAGGTTTAHTVTTTENQTYNDALLLTADTTLTSTAGGTIDILGGADGGFALTLSSVSATLAGGVGGTAPLTSITAEGGGFLTLNGAITTSGAQSYDHATTTLTGTTTLAGSTVGFTGTVDGAFALTVNASGATSFGGDVGGTDALASLTTNTGGTTTFATGLVTTTGAQTYGDSVSLVAGTTLTSTTNGNISLNGGVTGAQTLALDTQGTSSIVGATGLTSITTNAGGTTSLSGTIATTGVQTYNDAVTLAASTTITGTDINFVSTINGAQALTVGGTGTTTFGGAVGGSTALASLTVNGGGTTSMTGGAITTSGAQTYTEAVTATGAATFNAGGALGFTSISGDNSLSLTGGGVTGSTLSGTAVTVASTDGSVTINGAVTASAGDYTVTATRTSPGTATVTLGDGTTILQQATGAISISGRDGVTGSTGLTLTSNSGGVADAGNTRTVTLASSAGEINFAAGSTLNGGTAQQSNIVVNTNDASKAVQLGNITAKSVTGLEARLGTVTIGNATLSGGIDVYTGGVPANGDIAVGDIVAAGGVRLRSFQGGVTGGNLTGSFVEVSGGLNVTAGDIVATSTFAQVQSTTGSLSVGDVTAASGSVTLEASQAQGTGTLTADDVQAGTSLTIRGAGGVTLTSFNVGGAALISAGRENVTDGDLIFGSGTAASVTSNTKGNIRADSVTGAISLDATGSITGRAISPVADGRPAPDFARIVINGGYKLSATDIVQAMATTANVDSLSGGAIDIIAPSFSFGIGSTPLFGGSAKLLATAGGISFSPFGAITLRTSADFTANGGNISFNSLQAGQAAAGTVNLTASGSISAGAIANARGSINLNAGGNIDVGPFVNVSIGNAPGSLSSSADTIIVAGGALNLDGNVTAGGDYVADAASINLNASGRNVTQAAAGRVRLTATNGNLNGGAGLTLRSDSDNAGGGAVLLRATGGNIAFASSSTINAGADILGIGLATGGSSLSLGNVNAQNLLAVGASDGATSALVTSGPISATAITTTQSLSLRTTNGVIGIGTVTTGGDATLSASSALAVDQVNAGGAVTLAAGTTLGGVSGRTGIAAGGALAVNAGGAASLGTVTHGAGAATITAGSVDLATTTALALDSLTATGGNATIAAGGNAVTLGSAAATGNLTITAGAITMPGAVTVGGDYSLTGSTLALGVDADAETQAAGGRIALTATGGDIVGGAGLTLLSNSGGVADTGFVRSLNLDAAGSILFDASSTISGGTNRQSVIGLRTAGAALTLGTVAARGVRQVNIGFTTYSTPVTTTGNVSIQSLTSTESFGLNTTAGTIGLTSLTVTNGDAALAANSATIGNAVASGALTVTTRAGDLSFGQGGGGTTTTFDVAGVANLASAGTVFAGGATPATANLLRLTARDANIQGAVRAFGVTVTSRNPGLMRLGESTEGSAGFDLSTAEVNRIASTNLTIDGATRGVKIGAFALANTAGSKTFEVLTTGQIDVTGTFQTSGANRTIRLGGNSSLIPAVTGQATTTADKASFIRVAATSGGGGRLYMGDADLDLRAIRVAVGQDAGFISVIDDLAVGEVVNRFVAQPSSALFSPINGGGQAYTLQDLVKASSMSISFTDYALFQNTGLSSDTAGVVLNKESGVALRLTSSGSGAANAFAMFGTINGRSASAAALLGPDVIVVDDLNRGNTRLNGCLVGSGGGGCLITSITPPTVGVFDPNTINLFRSADDLALAFDPVVGANNEALFSDLGTIDFVPGTEEGDCDGDECAKEGADQ